MPQSQTLRAFWAYDQFPYVLSGEVLEIHAGGKVSTKEYSPGYRFTPLVMLPSEEGLAVKTQLDFLAAEYREALNRLRADYLAKAKALAPFIRAQ